MAIDSPGLRETKASQSQTLGDGGSVQRAAKREASISPAVLKKLSQFPNAHMSVTSVQLMV
jgi:hypothetical protein